MEKLTQSVEFALIQKDVVFGLQQGTKVLKEIHKEMGGIENVEKLMGETADAIAYQQVSYMTVRGCNRGVKWTLIRSTQEVSEMLGGRISNQDEDEVEAELEALEAEITGTATKHSEDELPSVPDTRLPAIDSGRQREDNKQGTKVLENREAILA